MGSMSPLAGSTMGAGLDFDTPLTSPEWGSVLPPGPVRSRVGDSSGVRCPRHWRYGRWRPSLSLPRRGYPSPSRRKYTANPRGAMTAAETPSPTLKRARLPHQPLKGRDPEDSRGNVFRGARRQTRLDMAHCTGTDPRLPGGARCRLPQKLLCLDGERTPQKNRHWLGYRDAKRCPNTPKHSVCV